MMQYVNPVEPRGQATLVAVGLTTFVCIGMAACLALVMAVFYFVVQFVLLLLQATIQTVSILSSVWGGASPLLKVFILIILGYGGYRVYRWLRAKKRREVKQ